MLRGSLGVLLMLGWMAPSVVQAQTDFYIEAEDFNYGGGQYKPEASQMPYYGGAYDGLSAVHDVDYHRGNNESAADEYRRGESPNVPMTQNMKPEDLDRGSWVATVNYRLGWIQEGNWLNYTRDFPDGHYRVYAALSHPDTRPDMMRGSLQRVVSGADTTSQVLEELGTFSAPGSGGWGVNNLVPLRDADGQQVILHLSGLTTLRFTTGQGDFDYLKFESIAAPQIGQQPEDQVVMENDPVTFTVVPAGDDPADFQWQSNRVEIAGATHASYTIPAVPLAANGSKFRCVLSNPLGSVTSREALLTVTPDTRRPTLEHVQNIGTQKLKVVFSEGVAEPGALDPANYAISGGVRVTGAVYGEDFRTVVLSVETLVYGQPYTLTVNNVQDRAVTPNTIAADSRLEFVAVAYAPVEIGEPALAGSSVPRPDGFDVSGAGADIGGTGDQFHFDYQEVTGNFDFQVRLAAFTPTDPFAKAGLMAREALTPEARFVAAMATPGRVGCFALWRSTAGGDTSQAGGFPVNYPYTWLRLKRANDTFSTYASLDGQHWTLLRSVNLALPATLYLGQAVTSRDPEQLATAQFRDLGTVTGGQIGDYRPERERLSPSSRRTKLVVSEIMCHPRARSDGRSLEFIELANPSPLFEDIGGWRISGAVDFVFPEGTILPADGFLVIAKLPADVEAEYGLSGVLGPYEGSLQNGGGVVRVRNRSDAIVLEAIYRDEAPWPVAADGGGHSLVLARPSYGESFPEAWAASARIGGSPGRNEAIEPNPWAGVVINEFLAHTDEPQVDFVELFNAGSAAVDLSGCYLTDDPATNRFRIPDGTVLPIGGYVAFDQTQLGFALNAAGEAIFLIAADQSRVIDAVKFGPQPNGRSTGRHPDGTPRLRLLETPTAGGPNSAPWRSPVVINEIMYHPLSERDEDEYVELYNRSGAPVDLSGWRFTDGIQFTMPAGTVIPSEGFLVVAKDAANLRSFHPHLNEQNTVGDYSGRLANSGERLALAMPEDIVGTNEFGLLVTNRVYIVVNQVDYRDGGRWGRSSDGGGSSLELIDPDADNALAPNWADSDETGKASWVTAEVTGRLDNGNGSIALNRLYIGMQGAGECLVDDVEVLPAGGGNVVSNHGFENGPTNWSFHGNHSGSTVERGDAASGSWALHIRTDGDCDTGPNTVRGVVSGLASGQIATIRAKVRWLKGWPQVLFRLRGNWLELSADMQVPRNLGTPGLPNSRRLINAGPAITEVTHRPVLPQTGERVRVTARVNDPDGVAAVRLRYRVDPSTTLRVLTMRDDGTGGDERAGDGVYTATLSGQGAGTRIAFHVQATDAGSPVASTLFPASYPEEECLIRWGDPVPFGNFTHYHLWTTSKTDSQFNSINGLDNRWWDATLVHNDGRVIYNAKFRNKASPYHGGKGDFAVTVPKDDLLLGVTDRVFGQTGNANSEETAMRGQIANWIAYEMGIPFLHSHYMQLYRNGSQFYNVTEDLEQPNHYYAERWFPEGGEGDLYKVAVWFEFQDNNSSFEATGATMQRFTTTGGQLKLARYRWNWQRRSNDGDANNYGQLLDLMVLANAGGNYEDALLEVADVEQWMKVHAFNRVTGNWDAWTFRVGQNMFIYRREGQRWVIMPWDIDFVLGLGNGPTDALWGGQDPTGNRMYDTPVFRRALWRAYQEAVAGPLQPEKYEPQILARSKALAANGVAGVRDPSGIRSYIEQRRTFIEGQIAANDASQFAITTNGGADFSTTTPLITLTGTAPFAAARIAVNGVTYPVRWTGFTTFSVQVPLTGPTNTLVLTGLDEDGQPITGMRDSITVTYTGELERPEDYLLITEIHYHPIVSGASFVEIYNRSTQTTFDLSGWSLSGAGFDFPAGTLIRPRTYLLVVDNRVVFEETFGLGRPIAGEFSGALDNGGETLRLVRPGTQPGEKITVNAVKYDDDPPWPPEADGWGSSLQLIDLNQDNSRVANWAVAPTNSTSRVTPGGLNSVAATLPTFPRLWINEVLPENTRGLTDAAGDHDPWIEILNAGDTALDLSALYLTDDYADPTKWRFPSVVVPAHSYLVVWPDGEPAESSSNEPHTNFRLPPASGSVALTWIQSGSPAVLDFVNYRLLSPDRSYGSWPEGQGRLRQVFHYQTPGAENNPASMPVQVFINEWMALNNTTLADPADGDFEDWFELFNAGADPVDLTGYTLTDDLTNHTQFTIPAGTVIPPGGYLIVWADGEPGQSVPAGDLHVNFKLNGNGEAIGLYAPDGTTVDEITFGPQTADVSEGRQPDGAPGPFAALAAPSPGGPNSATGNLPPTLDPIGDRQVQEATPLQFTVTAADPDDPPQQLTFALLGGPEGAVLDPQTGVFRWTPSEAQGPGLYSMTITVTDDGTPPRSDSETFTLTVLEVNQPPVLSPLPDRTVDEGQTLTFVVNATDPDLPANRLTYALSGNLPEGAAIDPQTGAFSWTPTEEQGPGTVVFTVRVTDDGVPQLSDERSFTVTVREVDNPPVMEDIVGRSVSEGQLLTFSVSAYDPDNPPQPIRYSLDAGAPEGAAIDPETGVFTWTPTEEQGPGTYPISIRATEAGGGQLSTARVITVRVIEENDPPVLSSIPDQTIGEGELFAWWVQATDPDLPAQKLTFSLGAAAPEGMSIDPATGWLTWRVPFDHQPAANTITVRVADDGAPVRVEEVSFTLTVEPRTPLVISEVMHHPDQPGAAFIEIQNLSAARAVPLEGLRLEGLALSFDFPAGSQVAAEDRVVVAANGTAYAAAYRGAPAPIGVWTGTLQGAGDHLRLLRPAQDGQPEVLIDEMWFRDSAPWPSAATQGGALQLVDRHQDNRRPANWDAVAGLQAGQPSTLVDFESVWRYHQLGQDLGTAWREPDYDDHTWPSGPGLLYVENSALPGPKNTELQIGPPTFYFRTTFRFTGNPAGVSLKLTTIIDDAAVVYLNGQELYRLGMPEGTISFDTSAARVVGNAAVEGPFEVSADALVAGDNVLAVEVHQHGLNSSDIVLGLRLEAEPGPLAPATPGEPNSLIGLREPFPEVWINEIQPLNVNGPNDNAGEHAPWIELVNAGPLPVPLDGWFLSNDYADPARFAFPAGEVLQPGEHRLIWADGQPGQTLPGQVHTSFALESTGGSVLLSRQAEHGIEVLDYLDYDALDADATVGNLADGDPADRGLLAEASPGTPNTGATVNRPPSINPIADVVVDEGATLTLKIEATDPDLPQDQLFFSLDAGAPEGAVIDPATGDFFWTPGEPDGPGEYEVTVRVTDAGDPPLSASAAFRIQVREVNQSPVIDPLPEVAAVPGQEVNLHLTASDPDEPPQQLTFALGETAPAGAAIDPVTGEFHWTVPSEAAGQYLISIRVTDNGQPPLSAAAELTVRVQVSRPRLVGPSFDAQGRLLLRWEAQPGLRYVVETSEDLRQWTEQAVIEAAAASVAWLEPEPAPVRARFYRVVVRP